VDLRIDTAVGAKGKVQEEKYLGLADERSAVGANEQVGQLSDRNDVLPNLYEQLLLVFGDFGNPAHN